MRILLEPLNSQVAVRISTYAVIYLCLLPFLNVNSGQGHDFCLMSALEHNFRTEIRNLMMAALTNYQEVATYQAWAAQVQCSRT